MSRPLQNRMTPKGEITATPEKGLMFGNRGGRIHNKDQEIVKKWASKQWICCVLEFKSRQRTIMANSYTELFFLDEATAMASGHRPCFECRRTDAVRFATLWNTAQGIEGRARAPLMDKILHQERLKAPEMLNISALPMGSFCETPQGHFLITPKGAQRWSFSGYESPQTLTGEVKALTPRSIRAVLAQGYRPLLHPSAISLETL